MVGEAAQVGQAQSQASPKLLKVTQVPGQISEPVGGATGLLAVVATSALRDPGSPHTHQEAMNEEDHG